jgi:hypothetical protein
MATITTEFGSGHSGLVGSGAQGEPTLAGALRDVATDLAAIRDAFVGLTAKLDLDAGVTDTDYASTLDPAALLTIAG